MSLQDLPSLHGCEVNGGIIEQKPFATKRPSQMGVINFITLDIMILLFFNRSLKISHQKVLSHQKTACQIATTQAINQAINQAIIHSF